MLRGEALLAWAGRHAGGPGLDSAAAIYQQISQDQEYSASIRRRASDRLAALRGEGSWSARIEAGCGRLFQELSDPSALLAMTIAGSAFRLSRWASLGRLAAQPALPPFAIRSLAGLAGFAAEATTFPLALRLGRIAQGRNLDWSPRALGSEWASSALSLGALRASGLLVGTLASRSNLFRPLLQQAGMFGGILLAHGLEIRAGLREQRSLGDMSFDALATLLLFNAASRLNRAWIGEGARRWEQRIETRSESLARLPRWRWPNPPSPGLNPALATSSGARAPEPIGPDRVYMSSDGEISGVRLLPKLDISVEEYRLRQAEPDFWRLEVRDAVFEWVGDLPRSRRIFEASIVEQRLAQRPAAFRNLIAYLAHYDPLAAQVLMVRQDLVADHSPIRRVPLLREASNHPIVDRYDPHQLGESYEELWLRYVHRLRYDESEFSLYETPLSSPESYERFAQTPVVLYQALLHLPMPELFMPMMHAMAIFPSPQTRLP